MTSNVSDVLRTWEIHRDETPCPQDEVHVENGVTIAKRCDRIGTGVHQAPDLHLMNYHGYSQDKIDGIRLGARVFGESEEKALWLVHQFVLLFQPAHVSEENPPAHDA